MVRGVDRAKAPGPATETPIWRRILKRLTFVGGGRQASALAAGTLAERPAAPIEGMLRTRSDTSNMEFYSNGAWHTLVVSGTGLAYAIIPGSIEMGEDKLLGRDSAGTGPGEEIALGSGVAMASGTLTVERPVLAHFEGAETGAVTSVGVDQGNGAAFSQTTPAITVTNDMVAKTVGTSWTASVAPSADWTLKLMVRRSGETAWTIPATFTVSTR